MRKLILAVWCLAAVAIAWNVLRPPASDHTLCKLAPNADRTEAGRRLLTDIINACTNLIESDGPREITLAYAHKLRGNAYSNIDRHDLAIHDYNLALKLKRDYSNALIDRGWSYSASKNYSVAISDFTRAIEGETNSLIYLAYLGRASAQWKSSKLDAAISDYGEVLRHNPKYYWAYYYRGQIKYQKSDLQNAIEDFNRALEHNERIHKAYLYIAAANCRLGDAQAFKDNRLEAFTRFESSRAWHFGQLKKKGYLDPGSEHTDQGTFLAGLDRWAKAVCQKP